MRSSTIVCNDQGGFSLIELSIALACLVLIFSVAIPGYQGYLDKTKVEQAIGDLRSIDAAITEYFVLHQRWPEDLSDLGLHHIKDPWGNLYQYRKHAGNNYSPETNDDSSLSPINSDYDLYSKGADGDSGQTPGARQSKDNIVRAQSGDFFGLNNSGQSTSGSGFHSG